jgi:hypothetical protein
VAGAKEKQRKENRIFLFVTNATEYSEAELKFLFPGGENRISMSFFDLTMIAHHAKGGICRLFYAPMLFCLPNLFPLSLHNQNLCFKFIGFA